jgi:hypothetical protein
MPRVYRYMAEPMTADNRDVVLKQFRLAGDYRRALAMVENGRRAAVAALLRADEGVANLETALVTANEETRSDLATALSAARKARRATETYKTGLKEINDRVSPMTRAVRGAVSDKGLYWGTYLLVEDAHARAADGRDSWDPIIVRGGWDSIGVQMPRKTKLLTVDELRAGTDTRAMISNFAYALSRGADHYATVAPVGYRNKGGAVSPPTWRTLKLRVGSEGRQPIWVKLHARIEPGGARGRNLRSLPAGRIAMIKLVRVDTCYRTVLRDGVPKVEPRERWEVQFTVEDEVVRAQPTGQGAVGFDIGWRRVEGGVRILSAYTAVGRFTTCVIPDDVLQLRDQASNVRSAIDVSLNSLRVEIGALRDDPAAPPWLLTATATAHAWQRLGRWTACAHTFNQHGHPFGATLTTYLQQADAQRRLEAHNLTRRQRLRIEGRVRQWIAETIKGHDVVGVEQSIRIDKMRTRALADSEASFQAATANPEVAAGNARRWIKEMALSRGCTVVEVDPMYTTRRCGVCGNVRDASPDLIVRCDACHYAEDQDLTACIEIRRRAMSAPGMETAAAATKKIRRPRRATKPLAVENGSRPHGGSTQSRS